jgi:Malonyl-CoA decarboxylase C-terminal domain
MLTFITDLASPLLQFIKDDPVRPEIPVDFRISENRFVSSIVEGEDPKAIVCVALQDFVPSSVAELAQETFAPNTAIFYTIWSYAPGAGKELLLQTVDRIREQFPTVTRFVTLSPKSEMAKRFHLKNGAEIFRENDDTVNYEYKILDFAQD